MVKSETAAIQKHLDKKLDDKAAEILQQFNETMSNHYTTLQQQLDEIIELKAGNG